MTGVQNRRTSGSISTEAAELAEQANESRRDSLSGTRSKGIKRGNGNDVGFREKGHVPDGEDPFQVYLEESEHPQSMGTARKWMITVIIASAGLCVACASSMASFTDAGVTSEFHVSDEVSTLGISLCIEGLGLGPLVMGPLSEVYGRSPVYRISYVLFLAFNFPVAFAPHISVYLIFRFVTGLCGSAFLSVAGGSVSDMFNDLKVANPMAFFTTATFIGPVLGPLVSGFINQNLDWRWTYYVLLMWVGGELVAIFVLVPETYIPALIKKKARRLRKETGDNRYWALGEDDSKNLGRAISISCVRPFQLLFYDQMALLLDLWTALILGILYLAFEAFPIIFGQVHNFNTQTTGMTFLGIGIGMILALATQPYWVRMYRRAARRNNGRVPPEKRLIMGAVGGICVPVSLFWLAFTTYREVHWIVPIIASVPFGSGIYFVFTSVFTYLVTAYRPIAASAMASNSAMRSTFAAVFPLFSRQMYKRLGTVGATALLAGLTAIMAPLPWIFYRIGARLRMRSRFAQH